MNGLKLDVKEKAGLSGAKRTERPDFCRSISKHGLFFPEEKLNKFSQSALHNYEKLVDQKILLEVQWEVMTCTGLIDALNVLTEPIEGSKTAFIKQLAPKVWYKNC